MIRSLAVTLILQRLGNRSASEYQSIVETEMQAMQALLEEDATLMPWFLITTSPSYPLVAGDNSLVLPDDFLLELEEGMVEIYDASVPKWRTLAKDDFDTLVQTYVDEGSARPEKYALVGNYLRFFFTPDIIYNVRLTYFARALPLTADIENVWLKYAGDLLMARTGYQVASHHLQDTELSAVFADDVKVAKDRLWRLNEARMHAGRDYQMGDN